MRYRQKMIYYTSYILFTLCKITTIKKKKKHHNENQGEATELKSKY